MKTVFILCFFTFCVFNADAQALKVLSFKMLPSYNWTVKDAITDSATHEMCALITIPTFKTDFECSNIVSHSTGADVIGLYVSPSAQSITIRHPLLGKVAYPFPAKLKSAKAYELVLEYDIPSNSAKHANYVETSIPNLNLELMKVEGGTFLMGSTHGMVDEKPIHPVMLDTFYIGKYEITQDQWKKVMGNNPSENTQWGGSLPVERVSWEMAQQFVKKLNEKTGKKYRLPTEAEWEYAAKGGAYSLGYQYSGSNDITKVAVYGDKDSNTTLPVGSKAPNELGLYDMSGNVSEWCLDTKMRYQDTLQINPVTCTTWIVHSVRGGNFVGKAARCRVTDRSVGQHDYNVKDQGFRVVMQP